MCVCVCVCTGYQEEKIKTTLLSLFCFCISTVPRLTSRCPVHTPIDCHCVLLLKCRGLLKCGAYLWYTANMLSTVQPNEQRPLTTSSPPPKEAHWNDIIACCDIDRPLPNSLNYSGHCARLVSLFFYSYIFTVCVSFSLLFLLSVFRVAYITMELNIRAHTHIYAYSLDILLSVILDCNVKMFQLFQYS